MEHFVVSKQVIKELIKNSPEEISKLYIATNVTSGDIKEIITLAKKYRVSFLPVPKEKLLSIYNKGYSGVLAIVSPIKYLELEQLLEKTKSKNFIIFLALDEIVDPQNFGSILRTSAAFEVDGVIIQQWNQVPVTNTVLEVSRGGAHLVPIVRVKNIYNAILKLKKENFWIYSTMPQDNLQFHQENTVILNTVDKNFFNMKKICIVLGNEHKGIRKNIVNECDGMIAIKHSTKIQSLNVSTVCGIILFEFHRHRTERTDL